MQYPLNVSKSGPFSFSKGLPLWAQLAAGLLVIVLLFCLAVNSNPYVSAWDEENSNFYETAMQALRIFNITPTAPTAFIFWDKSMEESAPAIRAFRSSPSNLRIYGVHLTSSEALQIRKEWMKHAPGRASLLIDRQQLLETAFHARTTPMIYILLPKQKKIYSYLGNIDDNRERMLEIISSE